jgi:hypothetical protein
MSALKENRMGRKGTVFSIDEVHMQRVSLG